MYPGEGMYIGDEPVHRHHLPKMEDGDDDGDISDHHHHDHHHDHDQDDNDHSSDSSHHHHQHESHQHKHKHKHPHKGHTPPPHRHHPTPPKGTPTPSLRPQQPLQPPTPLILPQPLQPPTPILSQPPLQPPILLQQPPSSPPRKPQPPPPMDLNHPHHYNDEDDDDKHKSSNQQIVGATVFILLLLLGLTFLILWLIYRPTKPHFTAISTLIYTLNTTTATTTAAVTVAASMQFIIHTTNPNKRTTLSYDHLTATVYYRTTAITPPVPLPPLFHRKHSSVIIAPVIGGPPAAVPVPVGWEVASGLLSEEAYGVVGFSWVVVGRVRYRFGGFKSGHSRVYVKCDVVVKLTGVNNGVYVNSAGQVPLLASPPCIVHI